MSVGVWKENALFGCGVAENKIKKEKSTTRKIWKRKNNNNNKKGCCSILLIFKEGDFHILHTHTHTHGVATMETYIIVIDVCG